MSHLHHDYAHAMCAAVSAHEADAAGAISGACTIAMAWNLCPVFTVVRKDFATCFAT